MKQSIRSIDIKIFLIVLCSSFFPFHSVNAQKLYNQVDWGAYFGDPKQSFGFSKQEFVDDIKVDTHDSDNVYICGRTVSATGSYNYCTGTKMFFGGGGDAYLAKYDRCGNVIWSRYFGDQDRSEYAYQIALDYDTSGRTIVYVAGEIPTKASKPIARPCDGGPAVFDSLPTADNDDAFIAKYDPDGNLMRWTYFGGGIDTKQSIADSLFTDQILGLAIYNHNIYAVGYTSSLDMYKGCIKFDDTTFNGGEGDGFLGEFNTNLDSLLYFTYIGGSDQDRCHGIKIYKSASDSVYIFIDGTTPSLDMAYGPAFDVTLGGPKDGFLGRWSDKTGTGVYTRDWVSYIGGPGQETGRDIDLDPQGNVFMTGWTTSPAPWWKGAFGYDQTFNSDTDSVGVNTDDAYVVKIPFNGSRPIWGTYIGGYNDEQVCGLIYRPDTPFNHVIVAGYTLSSNKTKCITDTLLFPTFPLVNPIDGELNGKGDCPKSTRADAFISELTDDPVNQQLVFSTYLGGSQNETNGPEAQSYSPSMSFGSHQELYIAFNSYSDDVDTALGSRISKQIWGYQGGGDAYIAKIIATSDPAETRNSCYSIILGNNDSPLAGSVNVRAFPVPFRDELNVELNVPQAGKATISIYDLFGREISTQNVNVNGGSNVFNLNMRGADQFYLMKVEYGNQNYWVKLVKD